MTTTEKNASVKSEKSPGLFDLVAYGDRPLFSITPLNREKIEEVQKNIKQAKTNK